MNFSKYTTQELEFITSHVEFLKKELEKRRVKELDDFPFEVGDIIHSKHDNDNFFLKIKEIDKRNSNVVADEIVILVYGGYGGYVDDEVVIAPTISQVLKWLRDEYFIHISTKPYPCEDGLMWLYEIRKFSKYISAVAANKTGFVEEEQAALAGIEYVLENII